MTHSTRPPPPDEPPAWSLVFAVWSVPALLSTLETIVFARLAGRPIGPLLAFVSEAAGWYTWALFTRPIVSLAHRFPIERPLRPRNLLVHTAGYLTVALVASCVWAAVAHWLRPSGAGFLVTLRSWFLSGLPFTVLVYAAVLGITYTVANRARLRSRERDAALLARRLAESELAALRMQIQPHFLFNTLNGIMALVRDGDTERAVAALARLSDLLRLTLSMGSASEVTLAAEVGFLRRYLEIEQLRFDDRLRVTFDVPPDLLDVSVPTFVLQPFVENAVRHGLMPRRAGGSLTVAAAAENGTLRLKVEDDGVGLAPDRAGSPGAGTRLGIANARATLEQLYGDRAGVVVAARAQGGVEATVHLPLRRMAPAETS